MRKLVTIAFVVSMAATVLATSAPAGAGTSDYEDPFFLNWPTFVPSSPVGGYEATDGEKAATLPGTSYPIVVITSVGAKSGHLRKNPVMKVDPSSAPSLASWAASMAVPM